MPVDEMVMDRNIHILYRHVHMKAEGQSRDPNKARPVWFSYERCFSNLLSTIVEDPARGCAHITLMYDGTLEDFSDDFVSKYYANRDYGIDIQFLKAGTDGHSAMIAFDYALKMNFPDGDLIYFLENDYVHAPGWLSKVLELYDSDISFDYLSLYDHRDKYFYAMYEGLQSRIFHSDSHHWRTVPSTCGSFIVSAERYRSDIDVFMSWLKDYHLFGRLVGERGRTLLTPIPGLSTHCMAGYLSPAVPWESFLV